MSFFSAPQKSLEIRNALYQSAVREPTEHYFHGVFRRYSSEVTRCPVGNRLCDTSKEGHQAIEPIIFLVVDW